MDITSSLMLQVSGSKLLFIYCIACVVDFSDGDGEACGTIDRGTQLYCPDKYHCCDSVIHSCCEDGYVCWKSVCISIIPLIFMPCVVFIVFIATVVVKVVRKRSGLIHTILGRSEPDRHAQNVCDHSSIQTCRLNSGVFLGYVYSFMKTSVINLKIYIADVKLKAVK
ncbi:uncharacterized protein LOC125652248 [Ostrea edulis]|uniref:uncharacterized protein LOC125652248 n=1 Tax=Ostrea edulis TaxID=37623 RepID=UPI002094E50D|nr:uncharacterized protein LOC125652248 [Ostrea edulis]XP_048737250.1 uncharacterized protein LOC125652248 [Ostrea edulis]XP_048737251.1 uncharacterized protein LOC125652248 [Ostrea edulis]XP_056021944.1 uncharacterized protein LOC125652248 [Ostrea edulis]